MYSLDDGNSYTTIESKYPADSARYIWDVPDDLLSAKAKIRIKDSDDNTIFDEIPVYIKPWQLTRFDEAGDFELFKPDEDGWQIQNDSSSMWPQEWWQQFNYFSGIDPYTNMEYLFGFKRFPSWAYPSWPLFVKSFQFDETYFGFPPSVSIKAYLWWSGTVHKWNGSSYGFAVSSLLGFYHKDDFIKANLMGYFENLFQVPLFSTARTIINRYNIYQFGAPYFLDVLEKQNSVNVRQTLEELKHMFRKKDGDAYPLIFYNNHGSGSHAVVPYNMEEDKWYIKL